MDHFLRGIKQILAAKIITHELPTSEAFPYITKTNCNFLNLMQNMAYIMLKTGLKNLHCHVSTDNGGVALMSSVKYWHFS